MYFGPSGNVTDNVRHCVFSRDINCHYLFAQYNCIYLPSKYDLCLPEMKLDRHCFVLFEMERSELPHLYTIICMILIIFSVIYAEADVSHIVNNPNVDTQYATSKAINSGPPNPYVFSYQAGRAPGHVDRQHTEVSDGTGVVRGAFSYVDPRNQVRTVQYVADDQGFHPQLSHEVKDSAAVAALKQKHYELYNRIAQEHATGVRSNLESSPKQSEAVYRATQKHLNLYEQIAAQHAAIGAQHEAQRLAFEATSLHPPLEHGDNHVYQQRY